MEGESGKTEKILKTLKSSRPVFRHSEATTDEVMRQIKKERIKVSLGEMIYDFLFGWVYVGWMRRIMVAASIAIILLFGYQQAVILKRINSLSGKTYMEKGLLNTSIPGELPYNLNRYKFFGKKPSEGEINVSKEEIEKLIKSPDDLQVRYREILELIENDPQLKKYIEERLNNNEMTKPNI